MKMRKTIILIIDLAATILLIYLDQLTKNLAVLHLKGQPSIPVIENILVLQYLENRGAAFGMLQNQKVFFLLIEILILLVIGFALIRMPSRKRYTLMHVISVLIAGGAVGNMIDRVVQDYVVDFIYIALIDFPIFNLADIYVTCATAIFVFVVLFYYGEEDFAFLSIKRKNTPDAAPHGKSEKNK